LERINKKKDCVSRPQLKIETDKSLTKGIMENDEYAEFLIAHNAKN